MYPDDSPSSSSSPQTRIEELESEAEWTAALPIVRQLWTEADETFVRSWDDDPDYRLFGLYVEGESATQDAVDSAERGGEGDSSRLDESPVGIVGVSVQRVLHHARHAWIHDIVVDEAHRGQGYGSELLGFVESWAAERDCEYVALANRLENDDALDFYEREGMERWGYVVETEL